MTRIEDKSAYCHSCEDGELLTKNELCLMCGNHGKHESTIESDMEW